MHLGLLAAALYAPTLSPAIRGERTNERASENNSGSSHLALVTLLLRIGLPAAREGHKGFGPEREEAAFAARARTINCTYMYT